MGNTKRDTYYLGINDNGIAVLGSQADSATFVTGAGGNILYGAEYLGSNPASNSDAAFLEVFTTVPADHVWLMDSSGALILTDRQFCVLSSMEVQTVDAAGDNCDGTIHYLYYYHYYHHDNYNDYNHTHNYYHYNNTHDYNDYNHANHHDDHYDNDHHHHTHDYNNNGRNNTNNYDDHNDTQHNNNHNNSHHDNHVDYNDYLHYNHDYYYHDDNNHLRH
ncbi:hypothetical protein LTR10_016739 [Elasticomyces elasticus]|uniref:DUF7908 domain-containing protein n=1 Tax=Exophiala sideris TaxID=1016849 RepID=A0ABR0JMK8_9EURO|nr:hypothetical protein LTR10_016739 [Elasticomyces elasticus]KAK5037744.1 hypothetical protein LTS07_001211 [Exophiala sideris]KAK5043726.1 hypothetical protein LTR13_000080 [Exophiala sideris]KAK5067225.1 hypothetical protein LTR69_001212 [Exophiala sideris]KAK5182558.1 hypothetical protein LTR44_004949 [Eurotiomycetes sp. CCFEE 6388]